MSRRARRRPMKRRRARRRPMLPDASLRQRLALADAIAAEADALAALDLLGDARCSRLSTLAARAVALELPRRVLIPLLRRLAQALGVQQ